MKVYKKLYLTPLLMKNYILNVHESTSCSFNLNYTKIWIFYLKIKLIGNHINIRHVLIYNLYML